MLAVIMAWLNIGVAQAADAPVVLELFTSQGCSSCPPADALLQKLSAENSQILALSFHIDYWNYLGWKDPYSSAANTERQQGYASALGGGIYTPELIVNGGAAVVGSNESRVRSAIEEAQHIGNAADIKISAQPGSSGWDVAVSGENGNMPADVWAVSYQPYAQNAVPRGENGGRTLAHVNNVTGLRRLGAWLGQPAHYAAPLPENKADKMAIIVQLPSYGRVIGAASVP